MFFYLVFPIFLKPLYRFIFHTIKCYKQDIRRNIPPHKQFYPLAHCPLILQKIPVSFDTGILIVLFCMRSFQSKAVFMFYCTVNFLIFSKQNSFREQHICVDAIISDH